MTEEMEAYMQEYVRVHFPANEYEQRWAEMLQRAPRVAEQMILAAVRIFRGRTHAFYQNLTQNGIVIPVMHQHTARAVEEPNYLANFEVELANLERTLLEWNAEFRLTVEALQQQAGRNSLNSEESVSSSSSESESDSDSESADCRGQSGTQGQTAPAHAGAEHSSGSVTQQQNATTTTMAGQKRKSPDHPPKARGYKGKRKVVDLPDCEVATNFSSPETGNIYTCVAEIVGEEPQTVYEKVRNYLPAGSPLDFRQHLEVL
ncbi:MAG TPA: hypothetical protein V6D20_05990, partial [Candidatus Obscuribacterales bacterium]